MTVAANQLQAALFARLASDPGLMSEPGPERIFDHRRSRVAMPYLVIGTVETTPLDPGLEEHEITIEAYSDATGRKALQAIADRVRIALDDPPLALEGAALVSLFHVRTQTRRVDGRRALTSRMRFRAVTE